ncbi:MAG TPA: Gfo/Idh/MocA family oxidoreductase [Verrucomicrobiales bacterium]|nr:Gfo/Idh/MocA family oxidoreductase [Verrucomicrobiales bacterium]
MKSTRRSFLKKTSLLAFPAIIPASARGADGTVAPSNRITLAAIGWGMQGPGNTAAFLRLPDVQVVAACDLDSKHLEQAVKAINDGNKNSDCKSYKDYREMLARKDIDSVMIAIPDHWHALVAIEAAKNGKDIYGEKPLARTIREQQAIVKAVQGAKRVWQMGSWQRSDNNMRIGAEIVRNGLIGKVSEVHVGLPSGHSDFAGTRKKDKVTPPPPELDWDMWIGPSKMEDYIEARVHMNWRWNYNTGGGQLLDWIGHHCDIAHWGLGFDEKGGPVEIEGKGEFPPKDAIWNTATKYRAEATYHNGIKMIIAGGHKDIRGGTRWIGDKGWVQVDRGVFETSNPDFLKTIQKREGDKIVEKTTYKELPDELAKVRLEKSPRGHQGNFIDCVKSRGRTLCPVETGHHSAIPGHLALISMITGRKIKWDPDKEEIIGDEEATKLMGREYRGPWKLA